MHKRHSILAILANSKLVVVVGLFLAAAAIRYGQAQTLTVLYSFTGIGRDGGNPYAGVVLDPQGNLYGTTSFGGRWRWGTVYEVTSGGVETILHQFNYEEIPYASLLPDANGNLYGTTSTGPHYDGGPVGDGIVYELDTNRHFIVLHQFKGTDGQNPDAALIMDAQGNLYSTTAFGGNLSCPSGYGRGCGTVFRLAPNRKLKVLYAFNGGFDGNEPNSPLVLDGQGNLYGVTPYGGGSPSCWNGCGTVFKVAPDGSETVLYRFTGGSDGSHPFAGLVLDRQGNIYGTTSSGGDLSCGSIGCGTVFKLTSNGAETVLHAFTGGADGDGPMGLVRDSHGKLYGTTQSGGTGTLCPNQYGCGTVFKVTPFGVETVLYNFTGGPDGWDPLDRLVLDAEGNLYGTTYAGGIKNGGCPAGPCGVVFKLTP